MAFSLSDRASLDYIEHLAKAARLARVPPSNEPVYVMLVVHQGETVRESVARHKEYNDRLHAAKAH